MTPQADARAQGPNLAACPSSKNTPRFASLRSIVLVERPIACIWAASVSLSKRPRFKALVRGAATTSKAAQMMMMCVNRPEHGTTRFSPLIRFSPS